MVECAAWNGVAKGSIPSIPILFMICPRCNINEAIGGKHRMCYCVPCRKIYDKERYNSKRELMKEQRNAYKAGCKEYIKEYKKVRKCQYCEENDWRCLDFHHINPEEKDFQISEVNHSRENIDKEISKCILICANCHRKLHIKED